jgi:hypothetical protein
MISCLSLSAYRFSNTSEVQDKIVAYCLDHIGKKVDRGECWDLAAAALNYAEAKWSPPFNFGTKYDYKKEAIQAGDIIQFERVTISIPNGEYNVPHHTAIVVKSYGGLKCQIAHQNVDGKKTVQLLDLDFSQVKKGKIQFYHPVGK